MAALFVLKPGSRLFMFFTRLYIFFNFTSELFGPGYFQFDNGLCHGTYDFA